MRKANTRFKARLSERRRRYLISDETKASKEYRKLGFTRMANDEARHKRALLRGNGY